MEISSETYETKSKWVSKETNQILEDDCERVVSVNDIMKRHNVGMFQIPQQRHCDQHITLTSDCDFLTTYIWKIQP